jgi:hypothetical protein
MDHSNKKPKFLDKFSGFIPNNLSQKGSVLENFSPISSKNNHHHTFSKQSYHKNFSLNS